MVSFEEFRNQVLKKNMQENNLAIEPTSIGDDFTAVKYFGNMRFSPKLRKKLTNKPERTKITTI